MQTMDKKIIKSNHRRGPARYGSTPDESKVIERILYFRGCNGGNKPRLTYEGIANLLNRDQIATRHGHQWTRQNVLRTYQKNHPDGGLKNEQGKIEQECPGCQ
jgi:hypothetical protein